MPHDIYRDRADRSDGLDLRSISFGGEPVVARIYFAARDPLWRTVPLRVLAAERTDTDDGFDVRVSAESTYPHMPLAVTLAYRAKGDELTAEAVAVAGGEFSHNRIGFCVLLDAGSYGARPATGRRGGEALPFVFPREIVTRAQSDENTRHFHTPFDELDVELADGTRVGFEFEGVGFEFEDQRNWTDPSYKAYSVSDEPWPMLARAGQRFEQRVRVRVAPGSSGDTGPAEPAVTLGGVVGTLPPIDVFRGRLLPGSYRPGGGFQELNAQRLAHVPDCGAIELAVNGAVHAADTDSVFDAVTTHGAVVRQVHQLYPGVPVHLAPVSFLDAAGDWRDPAGGYFPEAPPGSTSVRWAEPLGAAWVVASVAAAAPAQPASCHFFSPDLPADCAAAAAIARFGTLEGHDLLAVDAPGRVAGVAVVDGDAVTLALANTEPDPCPVVLPDGRRVVLDGFDAQWFELPATNRVR
jgi:hypothetical protein